MLLVDHRLDLLDPRLEQFYLAQIFASLLRLAEAVHFQRLARQCPERVQQSHAALFTPGQEDKIQDLGEIGWHTTRNHQEPEKHATNK